MRGSIQRRRLLVAGAALIFIGGVGMALLLAAFDRFTMEGSQCPSLELRTLEGMPIRLSSTYARRHVLLFFLASCSHCRMELEHLRRLRPLLASCDVFAISLSQQGVTNEFVHANPLPYPVMLMQPEDALVQLGVRRVPVTMLVDEGNYVDRVRTGSRPFQEDSVLLVRYCQGGVLGFSAVDSLGEDGSPMDLSVTSGSAVMQ